MHNSKMASTERSDECVTVLGLSYHEFLLMILSILAIYIIIAMNYDKLFKWIRT